MSTGKIEPQKSCPFCNSHEIITNESAGVAWEDCQKCGASGPTYKKRSSESNGLNWNTRLGVVNSDTELLNFLDNWLKKNAPGAKWVFNIAEHPDDRTGIVASYNRKAKKVRPALQDAIKYHQL